MSKLVSKKMYERFFAKSAIVLFYAALLLFGIYLPRIYKRFFGERDVLTVYLTRETILDETFEAFEEETGIRVNLAYFDTNEEMFAKFKINRGEGYDVVILSDYMVENLVHANLLQRLDHSKISHLNVLDERLLNKYFDPGNVFTLPLNWFPYGIGFNKNEVQLDNNVSWDIVFNGEYKVSMLNDAREAIYLSSIYLFGDIDDFSQERLDKIAELLIRQKKHVEAYVEAGAKHLLLTRIVPMAVLPGARMQEMENPEIFDFVIPREGSLVDLVNIGIPITSEKADLAHRLIDYLLSKDVGVENFNKLACNPVNKEAYALLDQRYAGSKAFFPDDKMFERLYILNNKISPAALERTWFLVKSA